MRPRCGLTTPDVERREWFLNSSARLRLPKTSLPVLLSLSSRRSSPRQHHRLPPHAVDGQGTGWWPAFPSPCTRQPELFSRLRVGHRPLQVIALAAEQLKVGRPFQPASSLWDYEVDMYVTDPYPPAAVHALVTLHCVQRRFTVHSIPHSNEFSLTKLQSCIRTPIQFRYRFAIQIAAS